MREIAFLLAMALLAGCETGGGGLIAESGKRSLFAAGSTPLSLSTTAKARFSRQLVIKFVPDTFACDPEGIARLSVETCVPLEFVRTMSGGVCVVRQPADSTEELSMGQETLKKNPSVEYLEPDAVMKAH